jgi:hypothetical protein
LHSKNRDFAGGFPVLKADKVEIPLPFAILPSPPAFIPRMIDIDGVTVGVAPSQPPPTVDCFVAIPA